MCLVCSQSSFRYSCLAVSRYFQYAKLSLPICAARLYARWRVIRTEQDFTKVCDRGRARTPIPNTAASPNMAPTDTEATVGNSTQATTAQTPGSGHSTSRTPMCRGNRTTSESSKARSIPPSPKAAASLISGIPQVKCRCTISSHPYSRSPPSKVASMIPTRKVRTSGPQTGLAHPFLTMEWAASLGLRLRHQVDTTSP